MTLMCQKVYIHLFTKWFIFIVCQMVYIHLLPNGLYSFVCQMVYIHLLPNGLYSFVCQMVYIHFFCQMVYIHFFAKWFIFICTYYLFIKFSVIRKLLCMVLFYYDDISFLWKIHVKIKTWETATNNCKLTQCVDQFAYSFKREPIIATLHFTVLHRSITAECKELWKVLRSLKKSDDYYISLFVCLRYYVINPWLIPN